MADILIRNLEDDVVLRLKKKAEQNGESREEFLREKLIELAMEDNLRNVENKYTVLVKTLADQINLQNDIIERNNYLYEQILEEFLERRHDIT